MLITHMVLPIPDNPQDSLYEWLHIEAERQGRPVWRLVVTALEDYQQRRYRERKDADDRRPR
jgi:hypothetical protein